MDEGLRKQIIDRVVREVLSRIEKLEPKEAFTGSVGSTGNTDSTDNTVVFVTSAVPSFQKADAFLRERYGSDIKYIDFCGNGFSSGFAGALNAEKEGRARVAGLVDSSSNIVLLAPPLNMLKNIADVNDEGFVEYLTVRSLLWGRRVSAVLDFNPPVFKTNALTKKVSGIIDVLKDIGMDVLTCDCQNRQNIQNSTDDPTDALTLVTESDVIGAWESGRNEMKIPAGCIVTPLARDKARDLGLEII